MKIRWEGTSSVWTSQDFSKINCAPLPKAFPYFMQSINFTVICLVYKTPTSMIEVDGVAIYIFGMSIARYISAVYLLMEVINATSRHSEKSKLTFQVSLITQSSFEQQALTQI